MSDDFVDSANCYAIVIVGRGSVQYLPDDAIGSYMTQLYGANEDTGSVHEPFGLVGEEWRWTNDLARVLLFSDQMNARDLARNLESAFGLKLGVVRVNLSVNDRLDYPYEVLQ